MKFFKYLFIISLLYACQTKQKPLAENQFRVNGSIEGMDNGEIYKINYQPTGPREIDTIKISDGKFQIEGQLKDPVENLYLVKDPEEQVMNPLSQVSLYVEPTVMSLHLDYSNFSKSKLKGSKTQEEQYQLNNTLDKIKDKYRRDLDALDNNSKSYNKNRIAGASKSTLDSIAYAADSIKEELAPYYKETENANLDFIKNHPKSFLSINIFQYMVNSMKYDDAKKLYDQFNPDYLETSVGKNATHQLEQLTKGVPGAPAVDFKTTDINGDELSLKDFRGKYVMLDFWASWCVPCRKGNPHLKKLYKKYHPKGFEIIGISDDDSDHEAWKKAVKKDGIGIWHHVLRGLKYEKDSHKILDDHISEGYNIHFLPTKILINPEGIIIGRFGSGGEDDEAMDKMLTNIFEEGKEL